MHYYSTKIIELGSCAFRQPYAQSHCKFLHGYRLTGKFTFGCASLDVNNWVVDFGGVKELKSILEQQFDHTTVVWSKDPQIELFKTLNERGVIDLRVMEDGVGIEKFAEYCFNVADKYVRNSTNNRCWVESVEVWEHEKNSGIVKADHNTQQKQLITEAASYDKVTPTIEPVQTPAASFNQATPTIAPAPAQPAKKRVQAPIPAPIGKKAESSNNMSFKNALENTSWGNPKKK
jgi:6-pyruvoyltetrahydropterin/6-carboxytetrahydropterin synthase